VRSAAPTGPSFALSRADAVDWLRSIPSGSVDLLVTDPPYESLEKHRAVGTTTRLTHSRASSNDWFTVFPNGRFPELLDEVHRVLARNAHFYLFCDATTMFVIKPMAERAGLRFWKPIVWDKVHIGMGYHYRARCEFVLFFEKGKRRLADLGVPDVLAHPRVRGGYPTEKPVSLCEVLVQQSSAVGELVVDPFAGSGAVGVAAARLGRNFQGNDLAAAAVEVCRQRLIEAGATELSD
jgi:site-specific DNA-methyltransferase (adenine-specific)